MSRKKNRWLIALAAIMIHLCIGSIYAYSVLKQPLTESIGWDSVSVAMSFSIAIFFLGITAAFLGKKVESRGPRKSGILASILYGTGMIGAGFAVQQEALRLFYLCYGAIGGIGLGLGYLTPVAMLAKRFSDRKGLGTGLAIMGFGFSSLIFGPLMLKLIENIGIANMFYGLGVFFLIIMFLSSLYLANPEQTASNQEKEHYEEKNVTPKTAIKSANFWILWAMFFINIMAGIGLISVASPLAQDIAQLTPLAAATMVGLMGIFNGFGRIFWSSLSDYIGRYITYAIFFVLQIALFFLLPYAVRPILFQIMLFIILSCYGGGFSCAPAFISDLFGHKHMGVIYGYLLTAWSLAGIVGPFLISYLKKTTESYQLILSIFMGGFVVALLLTGILYKRTRHNITTK